MWAGEQAIFSHGRQDFRFSLNMISGLFQGEGGQEGYTSQHSNVLLGSRRQILEGKVFLLSAPNLKDIPYKIDLPKLGQSSC